MTYRDEQTERRYLYDERAGMLTDGLRDVTPDEDYMIQLEVEQTIKRIKEQNA